MWHYDKQLALIADVRGGIVGADAIEDDELARVVAQLAAEHALHTGDAEPSGRDAWLASLSGLKDENDKLELERHQRAQEEYLKRRQRRANRRKLWYVPPPDQVEPHLSTVASGSEGGL